EVAVLVLGIAVPARGGDVASAVVVVRIPELGGEGTVASAPAAERELQIVGVVRSSQTRIGPVVAGMVDHHVEDDAQRMGLPVLLVGVSGGHEVDQVLLGAEARIDAEVVVDVVTVVGAGIVLEDRREPDGGAAEPGDVVEVPRDAADLAAVEVVGRGHARRSACAERAGPRLVVVEAVHHQEVDEFFAPFPLGLEIRPPRRRAEVDLGNGGGHARSGHRAAGGPRPAADGLRGPRHLTGRSESYRIARAGRVAWPWLLLVAILLGARRSVKRRRFTG